MATYRHGTRTGFWDGTTAFNQSTNPGGGTSVTAGPSVFSAAQQLGRAADNLCIYVTASAVSQFWLQVAHQGNQTTDEIFPDVDAQTFVWHDLYYLGTSGAGNSTKVLLDIPSGGGSIATLIPDWEPQWARLRRVDAGATITVTAGWEIQSD